MSEWLLAIASFAVGATISVLLTQLRRRRRAVRTSVSTAAATGPVTIDATAAEWSWAVDPAGLFTAASPSSLDLIGYHRSELIGQPVGMIMDPRELGRAQAMVNSLGVTDSGLSDLIVSGLHRDGSSSWFELAVSTVTDAAGNVVAYQGRSRAIGAEAARVVTAQRVWARIEAIIADKLLLTAFQPIVDLSTSKVIGAEALSRFVADPSATPDIWFGEAAGVGLGTELELLAVETALQAAGELPTHLYVSINVSPSTCLDDRLARILASPPIGLDRIVLELTEHTEVINYEPLNDILKGFRLGGLRVAIDDAGAGFASGQHILKISPDIIKLDRSLVTAIESHSGERALAASLVALATELGATVTAEGIETRAELRCVTALGVAAGQGYLLGRPSVTPREWSRWKSPAPNRDLTRPTSGSPFAPSGLLAPRAIEFARTTRTRARPTGTTSRSTTQGAYRQEHLASHAQDWGRGAPTRDIAIAVLDALPDATAILNSAGVIIAVNRAWRMFSQDNGGDAKATGVGVSYLDACARASTAGSADATEALAGLRSVLGGQSVEHEWEYPCHSPNVSRWFISRITSRRLDAALAQPHQLHGQQVHMSASIGSYLAEPGEAAADALHLADAAMYKVKAAKNQSQ